MAFAARILDVTSHPGVIAGPGVPNVLIGGRPAAVQGEKHGCAQPDPHSPNKITTGSSTVSIGGKPAARVGDSTACGAFITSGATSVEIGG
jgi:uncharacterized Zn-binding protein involved in type VI secretion